MWEGIVALIGVEFIGGALAPTFVKLGVKEFPPLLFTGLRFILATLLFYPIYFKNKEILTKTDKIKISKLSFLFFLNASLFSIGIQYTTVIMSQILYTLMPIVVLLLARIILNEKMNHQKIIGLIIAIIGTFFLIQQSIGNTNELSFGSPMGNITLLVGVFSWSIYIVYSKQLQKNYKTTTITFYNFLVSSIFLIALIPIESLFRPFNPSDVTWVGIASVLGVAVIISILMISLLQFAIKKTSAFIVSLFSYLGPVFGAIVGVIIFNEVLTANFIIGSICIIVGVFYATTYVHVKNHIKKISS